MAAVRPSPPRFTPPTPAQPVLVVPPPLEPEPIRSPTVSGVQLVAHPPPAPIAAPIVAPVMQMAQVAQIAVPPAAPLPVLSIPPFDGARKRRNGIIVVVTALVLIVGAFVATAVLSQLAH